MNPQIFSPPFTPATRNNAGGPGFLRSPASTLAQYALTGTLGDTFYVGAEVQLQVLNTMLEQVTPRYVRQLAVYSRTKGFMKDIPAYLCAWLAARNELSADVFRRVIDNGKMLRNIVQVCRSGTLGRKSIPRPLRRMIVQWFASRTASDIIPAIPGAKPSLGDILRMVHPKPALKTRAALFSYLLGKEGKEKSYPAALKALLKLQQSVRDGKRFKKLPEGIPFQLLDSLPLTKAHWTDLAKTGGYHFTRMNLNTFMRHGVLSDAKLVTRLAKRLSDEKIIKKARVFPYQLLIATLNTAGQIPERLTKALADGLEVSTGNVPISDKPTVILLDVSGSMGSPITSQHGAKQVSSVRCVDVAALFAATWLRKNPNTRIIPFDLSVFSDFRPVPGATIAETVVSLSRFGGGGTAVGTALQYLNTNFIAAENVIIISDSESWAGAPLSREWAQYKRRVPQSKLICIDLTPTRHVEAKDSPDVLNVGGFSDNVWQVIRDFLDGDLTDEHMVGKIEEVDVK